MVRFLLAPLSLLYGGGAKVRAGLYRRGALPRHRLSGPVVSVGNLSVGGSGKTPVVALVAEMLRDAGLPVAVLSRGYGGAFRGQALVVSDGRQVLETAASAGDEPVMLARMLADVVVAVGSRRDRVGAAVEARFGRRVHVLDDGFQHLRLHRDLDLLCLSASDLGDSPLPGGRLRELPSAAARAHAWLVSHVGPAALPSTWPAARVFRLRRRVQGFFDLSGQPATAPRRPYLLAGIARPERFASDAMAAAGEVVGRAFFRDHHVFTAADLSRVDADALERGADAVVITAKDAERLPSGRLSLPLLVLRIAAEVEDEARLRELVLSAVRRAW